MKITDKIKEDFLLFTKQASNTKFSKWLNKDNDSYNITGLKLFILFIVGVIFTSFFGRYFPIIYSLIWILIPVFLIVTNFLNVNIFKSVRKILIAIVFIQSLGIYFFKDEIRDFIGYNGIKGYHSHYEVVPVTYHSGSEMQYTKGEEVQIYDCDHWTGIIIIEIFNYLFIPLILILPYIAWKFGQTVKKDLQ